MRRSGQWPVVSGQKGDGGMREIPRILIRGLRGGEWGVQNGDEIDSTRVGSVRLRVHSVREVRVLSRQTLSGL